MSDCYTNESQNGAVRKVKEKKASSLETPVEYGFL